MIIRIRTWFINLKKILRILYQSSKVLFVMQLILNILMGFAPCITVVFTGRLINSFSGSKNDIFIALIAFLIGNTTISIISEVSKYLNTLYMQRNEQYTSQLFFEKCAKLNLEDFENSNMYNVIYRARNDGKNRIYVTYKDFMVLLVSIIEMITLSSVIITIYPPILLLVLLVPAFSMMVSLKINKYEHKLTIERSMDQRIMYYLDYLLTNDKAFKEIKLNSFSSYLTDKYYAALSMVHDNQKKHKKVRMISNISILIFDFLIDIVIMMTIIFRGISSGLAPGSIFITISSVSRIQQSFERLLRSFAQISKNQLYVKEFFALIDHDTPVYGNVIIGKINTIEFLNVSFKYPKTNDYIIRNINFKLKTGETLVIKGANGSGKTTIMKLICGLYTEYEGSIFVNGIELKEIDIDEYQKLIGAIFQDFNKYELSLMENTQEIAKNYNDHELDNIMRIVGLDKKFRNASNRKETMLGAWFNGEMLSGGEWQKLAICRCLLKDSSMFVLDEPTSSLDNQSAQCLSEYFYKRKNVIKILVTHKMKFFDHENLKVLDLNDKKAIAS